MDGRLAGGCFLIRISRTVGRIDIEYVLLVPYDFDELVCIGIFKINGVIAFRSFVFGSDDEAGMLLVCSSVLRIVVVQIKLVGNGTVGAVVAVRFQSQAGLHICG